MKRAIINSYGPAQELAVESVEIRADRHGEALIENYFSSINPVDVSIRNGKMKFLTGFQFPKVLGADFCGRLAEDRDGFKKGAEVFGMLNAVKGGAYADTIAATPKHFVEKPSHLTMEEAAAIALVGLTAYEGIVKHGDIKSGQNVFVNGCTGGVGSVAVDMAKALGARVTGTCSARNVDFAKEIGVDYVFDYKKLNKESIREEFDFVFDAAGKFSWRDHKTLLKKGGKSAATLPAPDLVWQALINPSFKLIRVDHNQLPEFKAFIEKHQIRPRISKVWDIEAIAEAHKSFEEEDHVGKVVIKVR